MFEFLILCAFAPKRETAWIKNDVGSRKGAKPAKARKVRRHPDLRLLVQP